MSDLNINRYDSKYQCVWDFLHAKDGAILISGLTLLGCLLSVIGFFYQDYTSFGAYFFIVYTVIETLAFSGVLAGIYYTEPFWLLLCREWLQIKMIFHSYGIFRILVKYAIPYVLDLKDKTAVIDKRLSFYLTLLLLNIFIFDVIYKCYKYVTEQDAVASDKEILPESDLDKISLA
uniref:Uncharacterized protein n=1 Tax=Panagrolaimus superbus TaxID=310955 RepID=A0A914YH96_9BILA